MAKKKPRKRPPARRPQQAKPARRVHAGPASDFPQHAFGVHQGQVVQVATPAWTGANAFWDVWAATAQLVTLSSSNPLNADRVSDQIDQLLQVEPDVEHRAAVRDVLRARADLSAQIIPPLASAQLVTARSAYLTSLEPWPQITDAYAEASQVQLPQPMTFFDLADRDGCVTADGGRLGPVALTGALLTRHERNLVIVPFGGPVMPTVLHTGGPFQPLASVLYGPAESRPARLSALEVFIDTDASTVTLSEFSGQHRLAGSVCAAACVLASRVLRLLHDIRVRELGYQPAVGDPNTRRRIFAEGRRVALTVSAR